MSVLPCTFSRGGFSGEVLFEVEVVKGRHKGVAARRYVRTNDHRPLGTADLGDKIEPGFVVVREIAVNDRGDQILVSLPDGEVRWVAADKVRPEECHVPIGSGPTVGN